MSVFRPCVWTVTAWSRRVPGSFTSTALFGLKVLERKVAGLCCCELLCVGSLPWFHFHCFFLSLCFAFCLLHASTVSSIKLTICFGWMLSSLSRVSAVAAAMAVVFLF